MKVFVYTLGCKLNQCESEALSDGFVQSGFSLASTDEFADLYIVNTCTVTGKAEQKARRMIRKYAAQEHRPVVLVTGCYAQLEGEFLSSLAPRVVIVSLDDKSALLDLPKHLAISLPKGISLEDSIRSFVSALHSGTDRVYSPFAYEAVSFSRHTRAFLKIQDGCDNSCGYCRVTIARGNAVSLDIQEAVDRTIALEQQGFGEIVLTGVNISAYSDAGVGLGGLLERMLVALGPSMRIRLSSLEPDRLDQSLIDACSDNRIQSHFHIPVQSASDRVLSRVGRKYTVDQLAKAIEALRTVKDDPFLAADVITGLPAEIDDDFQQTFRFLEDHQFAQLHVFPFSPRPDTPLEHARDRAPEWIRDERAAILRSLSTRLLRRYSSRWIGRNAEILLEESLPEGWLGLTGNYLRVAIPHGMVDLHAGKVCKVILGGTAGKLIGTIVP